MKSEGWDTRSHTHSTFITNYRSIYNKEVLAEVAILRLFILTMKQDWWIGICNTNLQITYMKNKVIWTIGHSTHSLEEFIAMLHSSKIKLIVDIRSYPGSRKFPQFNKETLEISLQQNKIEYIHLINLGGRRKASPYSKNTSWRNLAFRGYADYMQTIHFKTEIKNLEKMALKQHTAYMCSEAVWWRCHRAMVSDYLKVHGWKVMHIMGMGKEYEHPYTAPAKIVDSVLSYEN
jgi:uncharacterized protein (DUF488 family)